MSSHVDAHSYLYASICSGVGGLDLGFRAALPSSRSVLYVEREAYAVEVLAQRMEEGRLDSAPVWSDLESFDPDPWRHRLDGLVGGIPCPPHSVAGKREGDKSDLDLWPRTLELLRDLGCWFLFLENVAGIDFGEDPYMARIAGDLAESGWDAEWTTLQALEVGAPHHRERLFCLATLRGPNAHGEFLRQLAERHLQGKAEWGDAEPGNHGAPFDAPGVLPWSSVPRIRRMDDGVATRLDRLRACGNGVPPRQASFAAGHLAVRLLGKA